MDTTVETPESSESERIMEMMEKMAGDPKEYGKRTPGEKQASERPPSNLRCLATGL
jgi:hypothetical protein